MKALQLQGCKSEDIAHETLTLCHEILDEVGMVDARGVCLITLQRRDRAKEWQKTLVRSQ